MQLIDESLQELIEGEVVKGRVLEVSKDEVVVDIGYKSEGIIRAAEFADDDGNITVAAGDEVEVLLETSSSIRARLSSTVWALVSMCTASAAGRKGECFRLLSTRSRSRTSPTTSAPTLGYSGRVWRAERSN